MLGPRHLFIAAKIAVAPFLFSCNSNSNTTTPSNEVTDTTKAAKTTVVTNAAESSLASPEELFKKYELDKIQLPQGFAISVFAEVPNARSMCIGDKGTVFVGNREGDKVYAVTDENNDGRADKKYVLASGLNMPNGVAFRKGSLYVAEISRILRYDNIENRLSSPPSPVVVYDKLPTDKHHGWKFIAFGPDDKLYIPVGAPCNICLPDSQHALIARMDPDGNNFEIFAKGVRNSVGLTWHPQTKSLWFTDNGRDNLGDNLPNCELNVAPNAGMHFGYPFVHQGDVLDPEFGKGKTITDYNVPAQKMGPHVAPLGLRFYSGSQFPAEYKDKLFVALHGSWNRTTPIGYKIMMLTTDKDKVVKYEPFAYGWLQPNKRIIGRPTDIQITNDGAMLVSNDKEGVIYRISYQK